MTGSWVAAATLLLAAASSAQAWEYLERKDQASGQPVQFASVRSSNELPAKSEEAPPRRATSNLRVHPEYGRTALLTLADGYFACADRPCTVGVQFDRGKSRQVEAVLPNSPHSAVVLIKDAGRFFAGVKRARSLRIEARLQDGTSAGFDFDVAGFAWPPSAPTLTIDQIIGAPGATAGVAETEPKGQVPPPPLRKPSR